MPKNNDSTLPDICPCGSGKTYTNCCRLLHMGETATDAEALMRSRYSAYVLQLEDYLLRTWRPDTRPAALGLAEDKPIKWLGLKVLRFEVTGENSAIVEFEARYKMNGKAEKLHEVSKFTRVNANWYYVDGEFCQDSSNGCDAKNQ
jgi:SEC-C motif-containing protein